MVGWVVGLVQNMAYLSLARASLFGLSLAIFLFFLIVKKEKNIFFFFFFEGGGSFEVPKLSL